MASMAGFIALVLSLVVSSDRISECRKGVSGGFQPAADAVRDVPRRPRRSPVASTCRCFADWVAGIG